MHLDFVVLFKHAMPLSRYFLIHLRYVIITTCGTVSNKLLVKTIYDRRFKLHAVAYYMKLFELKLPDESFSTLLVNKK